MTIIVNTIKALPELLPLKPASNYEIVDAELQLRLNFSYDYKEYLSTFGAIIADGIELTGITKSEHRNVVLVTKREWELNNNVPKVMYVVENTGIDGVVIWQDTDGKIYQTMPNLQPQEIAKSLNNYILERTK